MTAVMQDESIKRLIILIAESKSNSHSFLVRTR